MDTWRETTRMAVVVLVVLGCVALVGAWRTGGLDDSPAPPPPGARAATEALP